VVELHLILIDKRVQAGDEISHYLVRGLVWQRGDGLPALTDGSLDLRAIVDLSELPDREALLRADIILLSLLKFVETVNPECFSKSYERL